MSLSPPPPISSNPFALALRDVRAERGAADRRRLAPGATSVLAPRRTRRIATDPLALLLELFERHGPVFSVRLLASRNVFALGPEANHHILVSHAADFSWRHGGFSQLIPLLGDGMLTIDGPLHKASRRIMLPAFHRERIAAAASTVADETDAAVLALRPRETVDLYGWTRRLALRIAMRALFGLDPDRGGAAHAAADDFEQALGFFGHDFAVQMLRGPRTPWARMRRARTRLDALIFGEIARRRRAEERGEDVLSLLLDATDGEHRLSDAQVRDQVMTLLFAGHDTTTATIAFLFHELGRHPEERERLEAEADALGPATPEQLRGGTRPLLEQALDETLRLYPPAWIGPRRAVRDTELGGFLIPAGTPVNYSSYVSHRLPHVFEDPHAFTPDRMRPDRKAVLPRGAYVPFGAGSRICLGMRFGQLEIRSVAARLLQEHRLEPVPGFELETRQTPTLGPRRGLPFVVHRRA